MESIVDDLPTIEAMARFVNSACMALSLLSDDQIGEFADAKTWEGLGYIMAEIEAGIHIEYERMCLPVEK